MKKFDAIMSKIEEAILATAILLMAFILIGGVISRIVFNASWGFTEEVGIALTVLVTFFALGYCARKARHISMSIIFDVVNLKVKKIMMIIICLGTCIMMGFLTYMAIEYVLTVQNLGRVTPSLRIPVWLTVLPLPIGFALAAFEYGRSFILNITKKEIYISSNYKLGENTDEAMGVEDSSSGEVK
ncbi:MAG: TRAP transporter small permease [Oscillospiraceae bacterium]|nr:TRAP transporter small permease [Oscillospiraceae bacterium]